jgi:hypothetical protein
LARSSQWSDVLLFVGGISAASVLGLVAAFVPGGIVCLPFPIIQGTRNGAPYAKGDLVHILTGKHRGQVAAVYDVWGVRRQVRVKLGESAGKDFSDLFDDHQVCRANSERP